jgi:hypothetical protein
MSKYAVVTYMQLFILALLLSVLSAGFVVAFFMFSDVQKLPEVHVEKTGTCIKVINFENGHAFNCNDVDVLLRKYRTVQVGA